MAANDIKLKKIIEKPFNIHLNTILLFNYLNKPSMMYDIYADCKILKENLSPQRIQQCIDNTIYFKRKQTHRGKHTNKTLVIEKYLKELYKMGYLSKNKTLHSPTYSIEKENPVTKGFFEHHNININFIKLPHFFNSTFKIFNDYSFKRRLSKSKQISFRNILNEEIISRVWFNTPVTKTELGRVLRLAPGTIKSIVDNFSGSKQRKVMFAKDLNGESVPVTTGQYFNKHKFAFRCKAHKEVKKCMWFDDNDYQVNNSHINQNDIDWDEPENHPEAFEYDFEDRKRNFRKKQWKNSETRFEDKIISYVRKIKLGLIHSSFSSPWRQNFLFPSLSQNSFLSICKNKL